MDMLGLLIRDSRFWIALILLVKSILFYFVPTFPEQLWNAIDAFLAVILVIIAGGGAVRTAQVMRANK